MSVIKIAAVTGGNKGIGFGIVKGLCEKFKGIVYLTSRDTTRGQNAVKELQKLGLQPKFHQLDINDVNSIKKFHDYIKTTYGGLDVLVNNAAIAYKNDSTEPFGEQAEVTISVNYFGTLRVCEGLFDLLRPNARVVNVSSSAGRLYRIPGSDLREKFLKPELTVEQLSDLMNEFVKSAKNNRNVEDGWGTSAYVVSKVGVSVLTRIQQREISKDTSRPNIAINSCHPGYVDTDMTSHRGVLTIDEGAVAPLYLALLPEDDTKIKGAYVWYDKRIVDFAAPEAPQ